MDLSKHIQKADEAAKRRNYALAVTLYHQILDLDPDCAEARSGLRGALDKKFETKKGGGVLAAVQGLVPLVSAGVARLTRSHAARARNLERYLALSPHSVSANLALGDALERSGATKSARVVYAHLGRRIAGQGPSSPHKAAGSLALRRAGALAQALGELADAMDCYEKALELDSRDHEAIRARKNLSAQGVLEKGGYATAGSSRELMRDKEQQVKIEKSQRLQRDEEEVAADLRRAESRLAEAPGDGAVLRKVGELRAEAGDTAGALDCLERALEAEPGDARLEARVDALRLAELDGRLRRARLLEDADQARELEAELAAARLASLRRRVAAYPTDLGLRFELGVACLEADEGDLVDEAIGELQRSVKDPRHRLESQFHLGLAFRRKGLDDLAKSQLEKALDAAGAGNAKTLDILYELGSLAEQAELPSEARSLFARILEVDIGYKDVARRLETLGH